MHWVEMRIDIGGGAYMWVTVGAEARMEFWFQVLV
jgi:hypothetical protein